ncbi:MAG: Gfo/Idh/MocA family oxidoreductase [Gemmatimonadetes bacterium]|jgi:predicted dehydrogenase|nr:Gfo/Idh/MocA family oxidoreductase [Gemmatimonadota bacterium]MBT6145376.1 Gfo/Idh/MocA family oxidoreductase [Gemmatimonadota bacterium]
MMQRARVAVIGTGWWATSVHIPALLENEAAELVALCDRDPDRLAAAAAACSVGTTYTEVDELIEKETLDGVVIATSHASHHSIARTCLEAGLHVMIEKPMTLFAPEAKDLVEIAARRERELIVGYPMNFTPYARRARQVIRSGELGPVQYVNCVFCSHILELLRGEHDVTGPVHGPGAVYSDPALSGGGHGHLQMTHPLGLMNFVTDLAPRRIQALMREQSPGLDLVDAMTVEFESGALASIGGTGNLGGGGGHKHDLQVFCERGSIDIDATAGTALIHRPDSQTETLDQVVGEEAYPRDRTSGNLVDVILGQDTNGSPGELGWRVVEILDASYRSARQDGRAICVEELYS